jgi:TP901 family phage tail tape measure protein
MSDAIVQKLGFDAGDAIGAISRLNTDMKTMADRVNALGQAFGSFNSSASSTSKLLNSMASDASKAADAFERLAKAKNAFNNGNGGGNGGGGGGGGGGGRNRQPNQAEVQQHIASLQQQYGPVPSEASDTAQRKYQNAITQAAQFAAQSKQTVQQVSVIGQNLGSSFTGAANTMANKLSSIKQAFSSMQTSASQNINKLTIDFGTFVRIVSTQVVVRALSAMRQAFGDAFDGALKFQTQVAEIGTIATKDFGGSSGIAATVRQISDAFNLPLNTSAEGYYETISNQIGDAAKSQEFLGSAAKLAKAGVTSLDQSVNLLSATLNAYGLEVGQTDAVASKYFETVRLGRVRVDDLANTMGRVLPQARQLGVGLDDVLAAIASITISGVKPSESLTQIRGAINALAKPTDELKEAFHALNVESAEQAVATYGFGGLLQKLAQQTDGTSQAFAQLFPNMRGVNGAIIVGKTQVQQFGQALETIRNAGNGELINSKAFDVLSSDAQKVEGEIQKLKNALVVDFGGALVKVAAFASDHGIGADFITSSLTLLIPGLTAAGVALAAYASKAAYARIVSLAFGTEITSLNVLLAKLGIAATAGLALGQFINHFQYKPSNDFEEQEQKNVQAFKDAQNSERNAAAQKFNEIAQAANNSLATLNGTYLKNVENAKQANDKEVANVKSALGQMVDARQAYVDKLRQAVGNAHDQQVQSQQRVFETQQKQEQTLFELRTQRLNPRQQAFALRDRTADLTSRASRLLSTAAGNPQQLQEALHLFQAAESASQEFASKAQDSGALQKQAQQAVLDVLSKRIAAEKQLQALENSRQQALAKEQKRQQDIADEIKAQAKIVTENTGEFDKEGNRFSPNQQAQRAAARNKALQAIQSRAFSSKDISLADSLGLSKFVSEYKSELSAAGPIKIRFDIANGAKQIEQMLQQGIGQIPGKQLLEGASGQTINNPSQALDVATKLEQEWNKLNAQLGEANNNRRSQEGYNNVNENLLGTVNDRIQRPFSSVAGPLQNLTKAIDALSKLASPTKSQYDVVGEALEQAKKEYSTNLGPLGRRSFNPDNAFALTQLDKVMANIESKMHLHEQGEGNEAIGNPQGVQQRLQQLQQAISASRSQIGTLSTSSEATARNVNNLGGAAESAAEKLNAIQAPAASAGVQAHAAGGLIKALNNSARHYWSGGEAYYAAGGQRRGVDSVPAMLAPGEFVMNARSTRNFLPQLQAMNAGMEPNYRSNGGHVTNVGDVTVNVNGAHAPQQTATAVASALKRLGRRRAI